MKIKFQTGYRWQMMRILGVIVFASALIGSCVHEPFIDPASLNNGQPSTPGDGLPNTPGCVSMGVCFESNVLPIFLSSCAKSGCHDTYSRQGDYILNSYASIVRRGISPGNASGSKLYRVLSASGEDQMPPGTPLTKAQKDSIAAWINQGAKNTVNCNCACDPTKFTYAAIIQPILANSCVGCHKSGSLGGNIDLTTYANVKTQVANGKLVACVTQAVGVSAMPKGGKLPDCQITQIKNWVAAGALNN